VPANTKKQKTPSGSPLFGWLGAVYGVCAVALIPWVIRLGNILPKRTVSPHWHTAWAGLDIMLIVMLSLSAFALIKRSAWTIMTTSIVGGMLIIDAWFDLLTSNSGHEQNDAIISAICIEIPLIVLSFWVAGRCIRQLNAIPRVRAHIRRKLKATRRRAA